jgi:hypothetical protein
MKFRAVGSVEGFRIIPDSTKNAFKKKTVGSIFS